MLIDNQLNDVAAIFEQWRDSRDKRQGKTPKLLRKQAVDLLSAYSKSEITKRLKVSHSQLKQWVAELISPNPTTDFVALPVETAIESSSSMEMELTFLQGETLRLSGAIPSNVINSIVQTLIRRKGVDV